ncbi:MAG: VWA domain-containing protein [Acidobacteria bacterium]|nr:VWA domain-containing protein [Acidobacteriota bacterium]
MTVAEQRHASAGVVLWVRGPSGPLPPKAARNTTPRSGDRWEAARNTRRPQAGTFATACAALLTLLATAAQAQDVATAALDRRHADFLDTADAILTDTERRVFGELRHGYQRDAFIKRFWSVRDPYPETPQNEFRERFDRMRELADERFGGARGARFEALLLHGEPQRAFTTTCRLLRTLHIWHYSHSPVVRGEFYLVFLRHAGDYRLWTVADGLSGLLVFTGPTIDRDSRIEEISRECARGGDVLTALALALDWEAMGGEPEPGRANDEWALAFLDRSTEAPAGATQLPAEIAMRYPGRRGSRTVVQAIVGIDPARLPEAEDGRRRFLLDGEVLRQGELFENFRYRFEPRTRSPATGGGAIPLVMQRYLRPGAYRLVVKVRDQDSGSYFAANADIDVPLVPRRDAEPSQIEASDDPARPGRSAAARPVPARRPAHPVSAAPGVPDWLAEANAAAPVDTESDEHTVRILPLPERLLVGRVRIGADAEGADIHRIAFSLNDRELISKRRPPYQVEIDLGPAPRIHTLQANAYDPQGSVLASDEVLLNSGPHRFTVRLTSPQRGANHTRSVRAVAEVEAPRHERLDRVEFFLNDTRTATLYQPPFEQPIRIDPGEPLSYVRVVAHLATGAWAEDLVFVNSRDRVEYVDVALIELYVSVTDRSGAPLTGLAESDFQVFVDGDAQPLQRFDQAANLPVHAGILFDTSTSMVDRIDAAEEAALHFFELVLGPQDRACLITFNDRPELAVGFTGSRETLAGGLADLTTEGETALYDSVLYALYYFGGLRGKRALILLTDGGDSSSEHRFDDVLDFARRSQVAIYSIGIDIDQRELLVRGRLQQLCNETGGRCFFITGASELKRVYERIETEVRSQYLLAFESPEGDPDAFRKVDVKLANPRPQGRRGVKVQTIPGYFQ